MFNWSLKISVVVKKYLLIVLSIETLGEDIKIFSPAITLILSPRLQPEINYRNLDNTLRTTVRLHVAKTLTLQGEKILFSKK